MENYFKTIIKDVERLLKLFAKNHCQDSQCCIQNTIIRPYQLDGKPYRSSVIVNFYDDFWVNQQCWVVNLN